MAINRRDYPLRKIFAIVGGSGREDLLELECGHEKWVLVSREPKYRMRCTQCPKLAAPADDPGASPASQAREG